MVWRKIRLQNEMAEMRSLTVEVEPIRLDLDQIERDLPIESKDLLDLVETLESDLGCVVNAIRCLRLSFDCSTELVRYFTKLLGL